MLNKKEILFLQELNKQKIPFIIVGLSAAVLQGAPVATQDVDIWFQDLANVKIQKALKKVGGFYIPPMPEMQNPPRFAGADFEFLDIVVGMAGLDDFETEYKNAIDIVLGSVKVKVLPLNRVIASKKKTGRQKDMMALPALESALKALESKKK